jgi:hypothetical protein
MCAGSRASSLLNYSQKLVPRVGVYGHGHIFAGAYGRGHTRGREIGDALALVDVPNLDPNQAAALQRVEVEAHRGAVQRGLGGQARDGQRAKASQDAIMQNARAAA